MGAGLLRTRCPEVIHSPGSTEVLMAIAGKPLLASEPRRAATHLKETMRLDARLFVRSAVVHSWARLDHCSSGAFFAAFARSFTACK